MFLVNNKKFLKIFFLSALFAIFFSYPFNKTQAANLSLYPVSSNITVGNILSVKVLVDTAGKVINSAEGIVQFPADLLEVLSISKSSSIFTLWIEEPKISNSEGKLMFNGGLPNPGYIGGKGEIVSIVFKTKKQGTATILFSDANVRENDGLGTDILKNKSGSTIIITENNISPSIKVGNTPSIPIINSSLTPDSDKWYSTTKTIFSWNLPKDVLSIETLLGKYPDSEPYVLYNPAISSKTVENLSEGVLYFHIRYQNENGWGKIAHKKIKIDNTSPEEITSSYKILDSGLIELSLSAKDKVSSISKFVLLIDGEKDIEINSINKDGTVKYVFSDNYVGTKDIKIKVYDEADNTKESSIKIDFPKVNYPKIITYPNEVFIGEQISISVISSYSKSQVELYTQFDNRDVKSYKTSTKDDGSFYYTFENIDESGVLSIWSKVLIPNTSKWVTSEKISISVKQTSYVVWKNKIIEILPILIPVFVLLLLFIIFIKFIIPKLYCIYKNRDKNDRNNKIKKIEKGILFLVDSLRENVSENIYSFKKDKNIKDIDEVERAILENLLKDLNDIEGIISSRLKRNKTGKKNQD